MTNELGNTAYPGGDMEPTLDKRATWETVLVTLAAMRADLQHAYTMEQTRPLSPIKQPSSLPRMPPSPAPVVSRLPDRTSNGWAHGSSPLARTFSTLPSALALPAARRELHRLRRQVEALSGPSDGRALVLSACADAPPIASAPPR